MPTASIAVVAAGLVLRAPCCLPTDPTCAVGNNIFLVPMGGSVTVPAYLLPARVVWSWRTDGVQDPAPEEIACVVDEDGDGDCGTDSDIERFFSLYEVLDMRADFNSDGVVDSEDVSSFFAALAG